MTLRTVLLVAITAILVPLLQQEIYNWCPHIAAILVSLASRLLPSRHRVRYRDEWLADLDTMRGRNLTMLLLAIKILIKAPRVAFAIQGPPARARAALARQLLSRPPEDEERKYLFDYSHGITFESLDYYRKRRHRFKSFVEAYVFSEEADAVAAGFYEVQDDQIENSDLRAKDVVTPLLVLRDADGAELWLGGCTCGYGGTGPQGSYEVLLDAGFPETALGVLFTHRFVQLHRESASPIVARKSSYQDPGYGCSVKVIDGSPAIVMNFGRVAAIEELDGTTHYVTAEQRLEQYRKSWLKDPQAALYFEPDFSWSEETYPYGPQSESNKVLRFRDRSGRELWVGPLTVKEALAITRRFGLRPSVRMAILCRIIPSLVYKDGRLYFSK